MINSKKAIAIALIAGIVTVVGADFASAQKTINEMLTGGPAARNAWKQRVLRSSNTGMPRTTADFTARTEAASPRTREVTRTSHTDAVFQESLSLSGQETVVMEQGQQLEPIAEGTIVENGTGYGPMMTDGHGCGSCGDCSDAGACGDCGSCGVCYEDCGFECCGLLTGRFMRHLSLFAGVQGFKGPVDLGQNGNFGFHEGINFAAPLGGPGQVGYNIGFRAVHSGLAGSAMNVDDGRDQVFLTAGLFRRAACGGFQWAAAFDLMSDRNYYGRADLRQVRIEAAFVRPGHREIGFWGAFGTGDDVVSYAQNTYTLEPTDLYTFFYRKYFCSGGQGRLWAGFTGNGDGLLGGDLHMPLGGSWAAESNFAYLSPKQGRGAEGVAEESWGMMLQLVWYPGRSARCVKDDPFDPVLNVADNSVFMVDRTYSSH